MATTRNAGITGDFVHEPLRHPESEIRLIHVEPSDASTDEIACTISTHPIDNAPPYAAISYTWGDMTCYGTISLNGKHVKIGENSCLVLWQVRLHKLPLPLWIDVLSIDQTNDYEKSIQVSIMGSIYATARFTCASVGHDKDDSDFLAEQIRAHTYHREHVQELGRARQEPTACSACGLAPNPRLYLCRGCDKSSRFCPTCQYTHNDEVAHTRYLDVRTEARLRGMCVECEQPLSTSWNQPRNHPESHLMKICDNCAELYRGRTSVAEWDSGHVSMNEWENMVQPASRDWSEETRSRNIARMLGLALETLQRTIDAVRLFSLRPYFSRLWVCKRLPLQ